jgi:hypothetical protein
MIAKQFFTGQQAIAVLAATIDAAQSELRAEIEQITALLQNCAITMRAEIADGQQGWVGCGPGTKYRNAYDDAVRWLNKKESKT